MKPYPFAYSLLKAFETCPRQYQEIKILKKYPFQKTEAIIYGERLHKACEEYIGKSTPLSAEFAFLRGVLDGLNAIEGSKLVERKLAITKDLVPCDFFDKQAWFRGSADIAVVNAEKGIAFVGDYKSGKDNRPDEDQLELMSLLIFAHFPDVVKVKSALLFVTKGSMVKRTIHRSDVDKLWSNYRVRDAVRAAAHETGIFTPIQSGLCRKHCPCTDCEFNGE